MRNVFSDFFLAVLFFSFRFDCLEIYEIYVILAGEHFTVGGGHAFDIEVKEEMNCEPFLMCGARILDESNSMSNTMLSEDSIVATAAKCEHLINENRDWTFPLFLLFSLNFFEHTSRPNRTRCDQRQDWPAGFSLVMKVRLVINSWNKKRFENSLVFVKIWEIFMFIFQCSFFGCERLVAVVADQRTIFHIF